MLLKRSQRFVLLASFSLLMAWNYDGQTIAGAETADAVARWQCDNIAGHPHDAGRSDPDYPGGVTDEWLASGPAVEFCETAIKLNPNNPTDDVIKERRDADQQAQNDEFNPSVFGNPRFISAIYNNTFTSLHSSFFNIYLAGFASELGGDQLLYIDSYCKPLIPQSVISELLRLMARYEQNTVGDAFGGSNRQGPSGNDIRNYMGQGERDAVTLVNRYTCKSNVADTIANNIVGAFH